MAPLSQLRNIADTGETLHRSGCAPYKIEKYLQFYARKQGINVIVQATPTSISCQFPDEDNQFIIRRLDPAQINLSLLARTIIRINAVEDPGIEEPGRYPGWLIMLANIAIPPAFLTLIGSALTTIALSAVLGFLVWLCQLFCRGDRVILVEFLSALVAGLTVSLVSSMGVEVPVWGTCIAAIVLFVPGLSIANSLECLAFNDVISGSSLFAQSIFVLMKLFIGIYIGVSIGSALWGATPHVENVNEVLWWMPFLALPALSFSIGVIFNARLADILRALPVTVLGMWGPLYLGFGGGWIVGTWVTAMCITLYGTWLAKTLNLTGAIYIVQGILILVPGSRVLMSATQSLFNETLMADASIGLSALLMFSAIVAGQVTALALYSQKNRNLAS
ncbi:MULTISPECIES: threonine/serine ThrE exporter family protein [unclassified Leisingera]|uniref:threonine/serine ThrE exporter family protein n=1 Tax=unclassified Leisingera TaxID=2614906 RepID=UPI0002F90483|nr:MULTISPECIES: threonine/serine exporter family protein [unclassified Leisingera]KIC26469.1 membrane protein [Leisingera sp. ANG-S3]KIC52788.1 membrane protein [Leisingera sp. ANG-S]KID10185.1 membrane protein [Leisingera sp. ANG1]